MWIAVLLACRSTPDLLAVERAALRPVELARLREAGEAALASGAHSDAAEAFAAGEALDPEAFHDLGTRLEAALDAADPAQAAAAWATLYEAEREPAARLRYHDAALDAAARARYTASEAESTRAGQRGVTREVAWAAIAALREGYVDPLDDRRLAAAAARRLGVLAGRDVPPPEGELRAGLDALWDQAQDLGVPAETAHAELAEAVFSAADPWSAPIWPEQVAAWQRRHDGVSAGGVGAVLDDGEAGVVVRDLVEGGAAFAAGVHQGDRVLAVGGEAATDAAAAAARLRGQDGTPVELRVDRAGEELTFSLVRAAIAERTAFGWRRTADGFDAFVAPRVGYVRIAAFRPHTDAEVEAVLPAREGLDALVLDLRGNRGGDLEPALRLAERFVAGGPVMRVSGRVVPEALHGDFAVASAGDAWEGLPLAVLVDAQTASSAEIVAGALQQLADAVVVGERTAGKGTSQVLRTDPAWTHALQYTNLVWALPDGRRLHRTPESAIWGVGPDVVEGQSPLEGFLLGVARARREALVAHADGTPMRYAGPEVDPSIPPISADPVLRAALRALAYPEPIPALR